MSTPLGVQLARCDLLLNNTSWVPIGVPCTMSLLPVPQAVGEMVRPKADRVPEHGRGVGHKIARDG
jgi:hypothetical protein